MSTLLLRLEGPMQSWGVDSRFEIRFTERVPSKSGVLGLLCAALGKPREERPGDGHPALAQLAALRMGVRVDQPGTVAVDYHTAGKPYADGSGGVMRASGGLRQETVISRRYYLADASFLVGLEGEDGALLTRLHAALRAPMWQLALGRKAFVPSAPVWLADGGPEGACWALPLAEALARYPWPEDAPARLPLVLECAPGDEAALGRRDVPLDFAGRRFALRYIRADWAARPSVEKEDGDVSVPADAEPA